MELDAGEGRFEFKIESDDAGSAWGDRGVWGERINDEVHDAVRSRESLMGVPEVRAGQFTEVLHSDGVEGGYSFAQKFLLGKDKIGR